MNPAGKAEGKTGALRRFSALWLLLPAAGVLAVVSRSSPFYAVNNWSDAQCFFLMGKAMAQGRVLYVDAVDQKGPLLFFLHCIANWVQADGFLGVWLIEIAAAALFLYFARRLFLLCGAGRAAALAPALVLAASYSTVAFQKGDSAEELCLPLLLGGVVLGLETLRLRRPLTLRLGLALGLLCGAVFWIKYNLCAPFGAVALVLLAWGLARRDWKGLGRVVLGGVLGLAAMSLPWLFYFWANGALDEMWYNYFYCNLFLYSDSADAALPQMLASMWRNIRSDLRLNWVFGVFVVLGLLWFTFGPGVRGEKRDAAFWLQRLLLPLSFSGGDGGHLRHAPQRPHLLRPGAGAVRALRLCAGAGGGAGRGGQAGGHRAVQQLAVGGPGRGGAGRRRGLRMVAHPQPSGLWPKAGRYGAVSVRPGDAQRAGPQL